MLLVVCFESNQGILCWRGDEDQGVSLLACFQRYRLGTLSRSGYDPTHTEAEASKTVVDSVRSVPVSVAVRLCTRVDFNKVRVSVRTSFAML